MNRLSTEVLMSAEKKYVLNECESDSFTSDLMALVQSQLGKHALILAQPTGANQSIKSKTLYKVDKKNQKIPQIIQFISGFNQFNMP